MKRLLFLLLAFVVFLPFFFSPGAALAVDQPWKKSKDPALIVDSDDIVVHEPLSDVPLTRAERIKLKAEAKKKAFEEKKKNLPPIKMIYVKGGCYDMGDWSGTGDDDEVPVHEVCLSDYYIGEAEVTNGLWEYVMNWGYAPDLDPKDPVNNVTWPWANDRSEEHTSELQSH